MGTVEENIGGGYNNQDGKFTAPQQGLYLFTANICSIKQNDLDYIITRDGTLLTGARIYNADTPTCTSVSVLAYLKIGNKVWLQCKDSGMIHDYYNNYWSSYQGSLIHKWIVMFYETNGW